MFEFNRLRFFLDEKYRWIIAFSLIFLVEYLITSFYFINKTNTFFKILLPFILLLFIYLVLHIRPNEKSDYRSHSLLIKSLNKGDWFLYFGVVIFVGVLLSEILIFDSSLSDNFLFAFLFSSWLIAYNNLPFRYSFEREWILLFFFLLFFSFTIIQGTYRYLSYIDLIDVTIYNNDYLVSNFLARPTATLLTILGYNVFSQGIMISYEDTTTNLISSVSVATGCSGIYSIIIFICLYTSYIILFPLKNYNLFLLFLLGLLCSYMANLIRMASIILVGHYYGSDQMFFAHANLGWIIFTTWIFVFWMVLDKFYSQLNNQNIP